MQPDLTEVSIAAVLMVRHHGHLEHVSPDGLVSEVLDGHGNPARRLGQLEDLDLLQVVEVRTGPDGDPARRVALVQLVVRVQEHVTDGLLGPELDVHQVGQLTVALPVRVHALVSQLLDPEARLAGRQTPDGFPAYFPDSPASLVPTGFL